MELSPLETTGLVLVGGLSITFVVHFLCVPVGRGDVLMVKHRRTLKLEVLQPFKLGESCQAPTCLV